MTKPNGDVYTCCEASSSAEKEGYLGNTKNQKLGEMWNHPHIQNVRKELLAGEIPSQCQRCDHIEKMGALSDRIEANEHFKNCHKEVLEKSQINLRPLELKSLDLRLSNLCNFNCRTCNPEQSSKWAQDYQLLTHKKLKEGPITRSFNSPEEAPDLILSESIIPQRLSFAGGEPLIHIEHYKILEALLKKKLNNCHIDYITNLSTLNFRGYDYIELWKQFKKVLVTVSIDGIGKQGEYIRGGLDWAKFKLNLKRIQEEAPHVKLSTNITVSVLNISFLKEILTHCLDELKLRVESLRLYPLIDPIPYRITILPKEIKQKLTLQLEESLAVLPEEVGLQVRGMISYMNSNDESKYWKFFLAHNKRIDQIRSQSFDSTSSLLKF